MYSWSLPKLKSELPLLKKKKSNKKRTTLLKQIELIVNCKSQLTQVLYMSSSFWLLGVESRDFSQGEKERTASKAKQIYKMTIIFTQNVNLGPFWVKIDVILWIYSALQAVFSFSAWEKSRDSTPKSQKLEEM